ncbi:MAG: NfeD family protein [Clostridia bacterium]|nr:NfeD family protein [Clostridia bacterium]
MFIIEWFTSMNLAGQIFTCIALPATLILLIQTVMMLIGAGSSDADGLGDDIPDELPDDIPDGDVSEGIFGDNGIVDLADSAGFEGLRIFTVRGVVAFFVVFGWVGVLMDNSGVRLWITLLVATVCGAAMMLLLALLFKWVMKLKNDGNTDNRNAIGVSGRVHLMIPPNRSGEGKVHLMLQGSYIERDAVTDDGEAIPTGSEVVVIGVSGQTTLVVKKK